MECEKCGKEITDNAMHCPDCEAGYEGHQGHFHHHSPTSGLAVASMVLGIVSALCWILTAIPGLVMGIKSLKRIKRGEAKGKAITGIVLNSIFMIFPVILIVGLLSWAIDNYLERSACVCHLKQINLAMKLYAMDNEDYFPDKDGYAGFQQLVENGYLENNNPYYCTKCNDNHKESYIYLGGYNGGSSNSDYQYPPLVFDRPGNHKGYIFVLFQDGLIKQYKTGAKTATEVVDMLKKKIKYTPDQQKVLYAKAAKADAKQLKK
jgi:Domain of unknown function (DUF4190)